MLAEMRVLGVGTQHSDLLVLGLYHLCELFLCAVVPSGGVGRWREQLHFLTVCLWWVRHWGHVPLSCVLT